MTAGKERDDGITDEMLMAFADGEADAATAERIEAALETDDALAGRLEAFVATRRILKRELGDVAREPVPDHLTRFVMSGGRRDGVVSTRASGSGSPETAADRAAKRWFSLPIAAAIAGLVAGGLGYLVGTSSLRGPGDGPMLALAAADQPLGALLTTGADGGKSAWSAGGRSGEIAIRASHKTRAGYCRTYGLTDSAGASYGGVACRVGGFWRTEVVTAEGQSIGGYAPASGMAKAIDAFLDAAEAEDPLSPAAVSERIARGWR
ncbi:MAG: anti-sigma factor family protein [Beijerinckiaceae bacterium]